MMLDIAQDAGNNGTDESNTVLHGTKGLTKLEVLAQSVIFMEAGYETTGNLMHFALYHVASLPEVQERLREEIDSVVGDSVSSISCVGHTRV